MSRVRGRSSWLALACLSMFIGFVALAAPQAAEAEETVWICKPGQVDDLCAGTISGKTLPPPGESSQPLGYTRPAQAPVDCFYLYPTQSEQPTPNSNLDKDPEIRRVVVQQARMFSTVCNVYAPMYRQVTYSGNQAAYNPDVEVAYQSAKGAFHDYLRNYNDGRGFIMLGHSQGSAHTARLIDELIDTRPGLRKRFIGAIAPGANIHVPINKNVGGMYDNVPACSKISQIRCLIAYSAYTDVPGPGEEFSRLDYGYWIYPEPRPDASKFEVVCTNPAKLDGSRGEMLPLANLDYLTGVPAEESAEPWIGAPDYYTASCKRQGGAHWLNVATTDLPGDSRPNLGALVASGTNWHVPEVNLVEANLLRITQLQTNRYLAQPKLKAKLKKLKAKRAKAKKRLARYVSKAKRLERRARKAPRVRKAKLKQQARIARKKAAAERKRIKSLQKKIRQTKSQIG